MATIYTDLDSYTRDMTKEYAVSGSEGGRINSDSEMRNYIASQIQRMEDNGLDVSQIQGFYDAVGARSGEGFANLSASNIGGRELTAIATTMMRLDEMQSDGRISVDEYAGYMDRLLNPDSIDAIAASGNDETFSLFEDIAADSQRPADPDVQEANAAALAIEPRIYINDRMDYFTEAKESRNDDPDYTARRQAEGYNAYDDMADKLREAHEQGLLSDAQFEDARSGLRDVQRAAGNPDVRDTVLFAMEDALVSGDPSLIGRTMSSEGMSDILYGTEEGVNLMREIEYNNTQREHAEAMAQQETAQDAPDMDHIEPEISPAFTIPDNIMPLSPSAGTEHDSIDVTGLSVNANIGARELADIMDSMGKSYFERIEAEGGLSLDDYSAMAEEYDALETEEEKEAYKVLHKDFAEADEYMSKLDRLEDGVMSGRLYISVTTDENGGQRYGVGYQPKPDGLAGAFQQDGSGGLFGSFELLQDTHDPENMLWINPDLRPGNIQVDPGAVAKFEFGADFLDDLNDAVHEARDPDTAVHAAEAETPDDGLETAGPEPVPDFDHPLDQIQVEYLTRMSPGEQFDGMLATANAIWSGKLGNGEDRKAMLEQMGYSEGDRARIQEMVNLGSEWCQNATMEDYDRAFPDPSGISLAEQDAAFQNVRMEAAAAIMTYESADDLMQAHNDRYSVQQGPVGMTSVQWTQDYADELYGRAAEIMSADPALAQETIEAGEDAGISLAESAANLTEYIAEQEGGTPEIGAAGPAGNPEPETDVAEDYGPEL